MKNIDKMLEEIASQGRYGDTMLAHISPEEAELLKSFGGSGTINPETGLPEFFSIGGIIKSITKPIAKVVKPVVNVVKKVGSKAEDVVRDVGSGAEDIVRDVGKTVDQTVRDVLPGGWTTAALISAGYYYYPEISAWVNTAGTSAVPASEVAAADTAAGVSGIDLGGVGASPNTWTGAGTYGSVPAAISSTTGAAVGKPLTASQVVDAVRGGLLVNALTGDPLGLSGDMPSGDSSGSGATGFAQVAVPREWKSPTYAVSKAAPVRFEDLFPEQSLRGTQWQGIKNAIPNMTFNQMFSSGQQQTPMGTPVDINQIVGSILGQTTTR